MSSVMDELERKDKLKSSLTADRIRDQLLGFSKDFKTSWVNLGQALYPVFKDKLYHAWGFEKFEDYTQKELGVKRETALRLLKTYFFIEQEEPEYLKKEFSQERDPVQVPGSEAINVLRLARQKKELNKQDYAELKSSIFQKGKNDSEVRRDLVSLMKERKKVNPEEEREKRNAAAVRKLLSALRSFQKDMEALKLAPAALVDEVNGLVKKLEEEVQD